MPFPLKSLLLNLLSCLQSVVKMSFIVDIIMDCPCQDQKMELIMLVKYIICFDLKVVVICVLFREAFL